MEVVTEPESQPEEPGDSVILNSAPPVWEARRFKSMPVWAEDVRELEVQKPGSVVWSGNPARFVAIDGKVCAVSNGEVVGSFSGIEEPLDLSADGASVLGYDVPRDGLLIEELNRSKPARISLDGDVSLARFAGDRVLVHSKTPFSKVSLYQQNGQLIREFDTPGFGSSNHAVSPDGSLLAIASTFSVDVYSLATGTRMHLMQAVNSVYPSNASLGLAFSPDSSQLAQVVHKNRLVVWNVAGGAVLLDHTLTSQLTSVTASTEADGIQWLPDGRGWLLAGSTLVSSSPIAEVWTGKSIAPLKVIDSNHLASLNASVLRPIRIPWSAVAETKLLDEPPALTPGSALTVVVDTAREHKEMKPLLRETARNRLVAAGFRVSVGAPVVFAIRYREHVGSRKGWAEKYGAKYQDAAGWGVKSTDITCEFTLRLAGTHDVLWTDSFRTDGGIPASGTKTADQLRRMAIDDALTEISHLALPSLLLNDSDGVLPIQFEEPRPAVSQDAEDEDGRRAADDDSSGQ